MGCPEMVVNSACRSGLFRSVGRRVFSSQARSCAEGFRESGTPGASPVVMVVAVPLTLSLMLWRPTLSVFLFVIQKPAQFYAMRKRKAEQEDETRESTPERSEAGERAMLLQPRDEKLAMPPIRKALENLVRSDDLSVEGSGNERVALD